MMYAVITLPSQAEVKEFEPPGANQARQKL